VHQSTDPSDYAFFKFYESAEGKAAFDINTEYFIRHLNEGEIKFKLSELMSTQFVDVNVDVDVDRWM
jgi:hypothetical protein